MRGLRRTGSVKTWRKVPPKIVIDAPGVQVPDNAGEGLFSKCFILAVTNPQPMIFCVSLMPQFIDPEIAYVPQVTFMIAVYPELPAEITLKPYGDPRNVMISR